VRARSCWAQLPEPELASRLTGPLSYTPRIVTDPGTLRTQLKRTRADGCAYSVEELEKSLNAVAAPVFTFNGVTTAALSASGPPFRLTEQRLPEVSAWCGRPPRRSRSAWATSAGRPLDHSVTLIRLCCV
jgi:DNA-binding IclR family transcriptional regulator